MTTTFARAPLCRFLPRPAPLNTWPVHVVSGTTRPIRLIILKYEFIDDIDDVDTICSYRFLQQNTKIQQQQQRKIVIYNRERHELKSFSVRPLKITLPDHSLSFTTNSFYLVKRPERRLKRANNWFYSFFFTSGHVFKWMTDCFNQLIKSSDVFLILESSHFCRY